MHIGQLTYNNLYQKSIKDKLNHITKLKILFKRKFDFNREGLHLVDRKELPGAIQNEKLTGKRK